MVESSSIIEWSFIQAMTGIMDFVIQTMALIMDYKSVI